MKRFRKIAGIAAGLLMMPLLFVFFHSQNPSEIIMNYPSLPDTYASAFMLGVIIDGVLMVMIFIMMFLSWLVYDL